MVSFRTSFIMRLKFFVYVYIVRFRARNLGLLDDRIMNQGKGLGLRNGITEVRCQQDQDVFTAVI